MRRWLKVFSAVFLGFVIGAIHVCCQPFNDKDRSSVIFAWIEKAPYVTSPTNGSSVNKPNGTILDALLEPIKKCGNYVDTEMDYRNVGDESEMLEFLKQNRVHIAVPIFEHPNNRRYNEFPFYKIDDYPGTNYITIESKNSVRFNMVLNSVSKSWPLLAVTLVLTAIAGIIVWALDTYWNSEQFHRSFIKGSLDGFWWSFVSMTTVGYGDKSPKSIIARMFSIIWILFGLIVMAIFTANVTSNLTAVSLEMEPSSLAGLKVAVLGNGIEYQHARQERARPKVFHKIDDVIQVLKSEQVDGLLLDRYSTAYYQEKNKLKSLLIVKKFEFIRNVEILFSKDRKDLADCLKHYDSDISELVLDATSRFEMSRLKTAKTFNLFDDSSPFVMELLYISLGVLAGLLIIGTLWEVFTREKAQCKYDVSVALFLSVGKESGVTTEREAIYHDMEIARNLLRQMQENFDKLEEKVSILQYSQK